MLMCDFGKVSSQLYWNHTCKFYLVNSLQIFRTSFSKNTSGGLLLILNINFKDQVKMCTLNRKLHLRNKKYEWEHEYHLVVRCDLHRSNLYLIRR